MNWNEDLDALLMLIVLDEKPYESKGVSTERWKTVTKDFMAQDELAKACTHFSFDARDETKVFSMTEKLKNRYKTLMTQFNQSINKNTNRSGMEGERPKFHETAIKIRDEIEAEKERKKEITEKKDKLAAKLSSNEQAVLCGGAGEIDSTKKTGRKRKSINDSNDESSAVGLLNWEQLAYQKLVLGADNKNNICDEEVKTANKMLKWITRMKRTLNHFITEAEISDAGAEQLNEVGLNTMITTFCARGQKYCPNQFRTEMELMDVKRIHTNKALGVLEKWKDQATQDRSCDDSNGSSSTGILTPSIDQGSLTFEDLT